MKLGFLGVTSVVAALAFGVLVTPMPFVAIAAAPAAKAHAARTGPTSRAVSATAKRKGAVSVKPAASDSFADSTSTIAELRREAEALRPLVRSAIARRFLFAVTALPRIKPRTVYFDTSRTHYYTASEAEALPAAERQLLKTRTLDEAFYYTTRYGSPLAYTRPLEVLATSGTNDVARSRIVDFGYGTIGHLRMLASMGADVVGVDVDPLLRALYAEPGDQGVIAGAGAVRGTLTIATGQFPVDPDPLLKVSEGVSLFISKNTLKNGYIHPAEPVNPRMLVHLGVDDTVFVRSLFRVLKPGGLVLIYNLCPAPAPPDKPYIPWADGRCPFARALWEASGFEVIAFDKDDSPAARQMGHALGWDQGHSPIDFEKDLFATYTLVQKPSP